MYDDLRPPRNAISVRGSALVEVAPDRALIVAAINELRDHPQSAFDDVRSTAAKINSYLKKQKSLEFNTSRITLNGHHEYVDGVSKFVGYQASVVYRVTSHNPDEAEMLLAGLLSAGASEVREVVFESSRIAEVRAEARKQAMAAARRRAELYCIAEGLKAGRAIMMRDTSEDSERVDYLRHGPRSGGAGPSFQPANVEVTASVEVAFEIVAPRSPRRTSGRARKRV